MARLLVLLLLAGLAVALTEEVLSQKWGEYKTMFGKSYSTAEDGRRRDIFRANYRTMLSLSDPTVGMSPFLDETYDEFTSKRLIKVPYTESEKKPLVTKILSTLPDSWDWRDHGRVTPTKDQASCGSCWAFSAIQNVEGVYAERHPLTAFAPEQLVDCDTLDCGCFGGWPRLGFDYLIQHAQGYLAPEASYPYCIPPHGNCYPCNTNASYCPTSTYCNRSCEAKPDPARSARIVDWVRISSDEAAIQTELYQRGPLSVCLNAEWLQFYHHGVSDPAWCDPKGLNHAVLLVGWGEETVLGKKVPFWIVKNSWGTGWGEKGYFRLIRGKGKCGINKEVVSAVVA